MKLHVQPPALFESPRDKYTIFVTCIHPWAEALGWILKIKWCICPRSIQNRAGTLSTHTSRKPVCPPKIVKCWFPQNWVELPLIHNFFAIYLFFSLRMVVWARSYSVARLSMCCPVTTGRSTIFCCLRTDCSLVEAGTNSTCWHSTHHKISSTPQKNHAWPATKASQPWCRSWHVKGLHCNATNVIVLPLTIYTSLIYRLS